jgi:predicted RNase H-like HicB family nuclease
MILLRKNYSFVITQGIDGYYIATVPELPGVFTQAKQLNDVFPRVKEAIEVYLETIEEEKNASTEDIKFIGVNQIEVEVG